MLRIEYDEVDQIKNGLGWRVKNGDLPKVTYTFYIYIGTESDPEWSFSVDSVEEGYSESVAWVNENCTVILNSKEGV